MRNIWNNPFFSPFHSFGQAQLFPFFFFFSLSPLSVSNILFSHFLSSLAVFCPKNRGSLVYRHLLIIRKSYKQSYLVTIGTLEVLIPSDALVEREREREINSERKRQRERERERDKFREKKVERERGKE